MTSNRGETVQRILVEIGRNVDSGDRIATLIHIDDARRNGEITERDAGRLIAFLDGLRDGSRPRSRSA